MWRQFLAAHVDTVLLQRLYMLVVLEIQTRAVNTSGQADRRQVLTLSPDATTIVL